MGPIVRDVEPPGDLDLDDMTGEQLFEAKLAAQAEVNRARQRIEDTSIHRQGRAVLVREPVAEQQARAVLERWARRLRRIQDKLAQGRRRLPSFESLFVQIAKDTLQPMVFGLIRRQALDELERRRREHGRCG